MTNQRGRGRARLDRAVTTDGTETHADALQAAADSLPRLINKLIEKADAGDSDAIDALIKINADEFSRARSGANNPVLLRILEIREAGSEKEYALWQKLYRNGMPELEEPI